MLAVMALPFTSQAEPFGFRRVFGIGVGPRGEVPMSNVEARSAMEGLSVLGAGVLRGGAESDLYRSILDVLPAAIYATDAEGKVTYFNRAAAELAGREPEIGRDEWCVTWRLYMPDGTPLP